MGKKPATVKQVTAPLPKFNPDHPQTFMEISIGGQNLGRVVFELFPKEVPVTVENFRSLCTGERGGNLHYTNRFFHRIIQGFMMQGGRIVDSQGNGMKSIYGDYFPDEPVWIPHTHKGQLSMANRGPNTNGSSFFVCFDAAPHLDNKHTVFGRVISGYDQVIQHVENI
jgi:cyclophilin family peptidyl-prolyl cis-trans isomerase